MVGLFYLVVFHAPSFLTLPVIPRYELSPTESPPLSQGRGKRREESELGHCFHLIVREAARGAHRDAQAVLLATVQTGTQRLGCYRDATVSI